MSTTSDAAAPPPGRMLLSVIFYQLLLARFLTTLSYGFEPRPISKNTELTNAMRYICNWHFAARTSSIALSAEVETRAAQHFFNDLVDQVLKHLADLKIQLDLFCVHHPESWDYFNILLVDSASSYRKINPGEKTKHQDYSEFYLVVLKPLNEHEYLREMQDIFAYCWSYYIVNVSVMIEDFSGSVRTFTYFPFATGRCFSINIVELRGLDFREIFPSKVSNLHKCALIGALWNVPPFLELNARAKGLDKFKGLEGTLINELAAKLNFSLKYITPPNDSQRGLVFKNGTVTGAIKLEKAAHLSLGCFRCTLERSTVLSPSHSFYQTNQVYTVKAQTEPWSTFEIITYPFDTYIWALMLIIMLAAISLSLWLEKYHPVSLHFIFGYRNSVLNIISAWLGSPVIPEPRRNFARYLLTLWIFVALILRNAYQGLLFDILCSNMGKKPPDTSEQLAEQQYSLVVNLASSDTFSGVPIIRDGLLNVIVKNISDAGGYPLLERPGEKYATATPKDFLSFYVKTYQKYGIYHVLRESIFAQQICIYFTKHSFLTQPFNEFLMNIRRFGFIDLWSSQYIDDSFIELREAGPRGGVPLTMHQLLGVFQILIVCLSAAGVVFVGEVLSRKSQLNECNTGK